jgi:hypothetical protein
MLQRTAGEAFQENQETGFGRIIRTFDPEAPVRARGVSFKERKPAPRSDTAAMTFRRSRVDRASRSSRVTTSTSRARRCLSCSRRRLRARLWQMRWCSRTSG